jgi:hypothetical protein
MSIPYKMLSLNYASGDADAVNKKLAKMTQAGDVDAVKTSKENTGIMQAELRILCKIPGEDARKKIRPNPIHTGL